MRVTIGTAQVQLFQGKDFDFNNHRLKEEIDKVRSARSSMADSNMSMMSNVSEAINKDYLSRAPPKVFYNYSR